MKEHSYKLVFYLVPPDKYKAIRLLLLLAPLIYILAIAFTANIHEPGTITALVIGGIITFIVFDVTLYPTIFRSKIILENDLVKIEMPGLISFKESVSRSEIKEAYICKVTKCIGAFYLRLYGLSVPGVIAVGLFRFSKGIEAYVASVKPLGENIVAKIHEKKYLILRPYNFEEFVKVFSEKVAPVMKKTQTKYFVS